MRSYTIFPVIIAICLFGCEKKSQAPAQQVASASATVASEPAPEPQKREPVTDIDPQELLQAMGCPSKTHHAACEVLEGFDKAEPWDLTTIRGDMARYFGQATTYKDGVAEQRWVFMLVKKMPLNEIEPGDLAVRVALRDLDPNLVAENKHADKLLYLLKQDDAISKRNQTSEYILGYNSNSWDSAAPTKGKSTILHIGGGTYVRQDDKRRLYLISMEARRPGAAQADATLVRLYPLSW